MHGGPWALSLSKVGETSEQTRSPALGILLLFFPFSVPLHQYHQPHPLHKTLCQALSDPGEDGAVCQCWGLSLLPGQQSPRLHSGLPDSAGPGSLCSLHCDKPPGTADAALPGTTQAELLGLRKTLPQPPRLRVLAMSEPEGLGEHQIIWELVSAFPHLRRGRCQAGESVFSSSTHSQAQGSVRNKQSSVLGFQVLQTVPAPSGTPLLCHLTWYLQFLDRVYTTDDFLVG